VLSYPWLAGQVIIDGGSTSWQARQFVAGGNKSHRPNIVPLEPNFRLIEKNHTNDPKVPSIKELVDAKFPVRLLDGKMFTPLKGRPSKYGDSGEYPAFFIQANFIKAAFSFAAAEHSTMDGHGLGETIRLFHKACHKEAFTTEELFEGNRARGDIVPLLDVDRASYKPGPELHYMFARQTSNKPPADRQAYSWACFRLPVMRLSVLKSLATEARVDTFQLIMSFPLSEINMFLFVPCLIRSSQLISSQLLVWKQHPEWKIHQYHPFS
jgi:hypothetical protein